MPLNIKAIGHTAPLIYEEEVTSTNDLAAQLGKEGTAPFTTVMAERQTAGRGRHGRAWRTFPYHSLAMSIVIPNTAPELPLVACLSLYKSCVALGVAGLGVKWPNDLMLDGRKVAGVLTESYANQTGEGRFFVLGCGVNITQPNEDIPDVAGFLATGTAQPLSREGVAKLFLQTLQQDVAKLSHHGFTHFVSDYKKACITLGQGVIWREAGREVSGLAADITADGCILLDTDTGRISCHSGEIIINK